MKTIRVGLAYYNGSKYIDEQINSLLKQKIDKTKYKFEIFVYNDNSDESNTMYINNLASKHSEITVEHNSPGKGAGKTFMNMFFDAQDSGIDYFFFCDQDDLWDLEKVSKQLELLRDNIGSTVLSSKWDGERVVKYIKPRRQSWLGHQMAFNMKMFFEKINLTRDSFEKAVSVNKDMFALTYHDLFIRVIFLTHGLEFAHINEYLVNHRVHNQSQTNSNSYAGLIERAKKNNGYVQYYSFYKKCMPIAIGEKVSISKFNKMYFLGDASPLGGWMRWKYNNFCMRFRLKLLYILPNLIIYRLKKKKFK